MSNKEKLRQQLLEQTLGKNAKNRRISQVHNDLEGILRYQQETIDELSQNVTDETLKKINLEIEKDFGIKYVDQQEADIQSIDQLSLQLKDKWHYDEFIDYVLSFIKKSKLLEKKEYSLLVYNYQPIKEVIEDIVLLLNQNHFLKTADISVIDFSSYTNKTEIFYQDIYRCLYDESQVIIFDHIEALPVNYIQSIIHLLQNKKMNLLNRYVEVQGHLKETNNQLVKNALSYLTWDNKYIILLSHDSLNNLTNRFGSPFIKVIDEIKEFVQLKEEDHFAFIEQKIKSIHEKMEKQLKIKIEEEIYQYVIQEKIEDIDDMLEDLFAEVIDIYEKDSMTSIHIIYKDHHLYMQTQQEEIELLKQDDLNFEEIDKELQQLVGLEEVKKHLSSLKQYYSVLQRRKKQGKKVMDVSKHMIFTGNPGTGKTTVARILAQYLKAAGILESGHLIEVSRKDLVGQYVGHTAVLTSQVISSALGGVLFIDEAYSLYRGQNDSFGLEAIDTLVKAMEDHRDELVVVLAGYQREMEEFLTSNSGLRSRFSNIIEFKDYTGEELYQIACSIASSKDYKIDDQCQVNLSLYLGQRNKREGGNGRLARNVVEKAMIHQSLRNTDDDLLILEDFFDEGSEVIE